ncbi:MAG TPA: glycosyltransferase family 9 protein [Nitrospiraceae bacterium]|nr:glycosyltransferase family 9 protein [Nitrospiraceae bacterium]
MNHHTAHFAERLSLKGKAPRTIAVLRALQLGDLLCTVPALRSLRAACPDSHIALIGLPWAREFVSRYGDYVDEFVEFPGFPGLPERPVDTEALPRFLAAMQRRHFDLVLQLHGNGRYSNTIAALLGGDMTAGYYQPPDYCPDAELFMPYPDQLPEVLRHLELLQHLGIPVRRTDLEFPLTGKDHERFSRLHEAEQLRPGTYVCVHPGGRGQDRRWSPAYFGIVADRLAAEGYEVVVTGTSEERDIVKAMLATMQSSPINLVGRTDLGTMGVLLSRAKALLANDTGVSHLAAALKIPSVIVCIGSDPNRWSPLDRRQHRVLFGHMTAVDSVLNELQDVLRSEDNPIAVTLGHSPVPLPINNSESLVTRNHQYLTGL